MKPREAPAANTWGSLQATAKRTLETGTGPFPLSLATQVLLANAPRKPEREPWNLRAKMRAGRRIANEESRRHAGHHNDHADGMRHARWSKRMADEIGPVFAISVGLAHEIDGLLQGRPVSEAVMDTINNMEGVSASLWRRPIDEDRIQSSPISAAGAAAKA